MMLNQSLAIACFLVLQLAAAAPFPVADSIPQARALSGNQKRDSNLGANGAIEVLENHKRDEIDSYTDNYPASESGSEKRDEIDSYTDNYPASESGPQKRDEIDSYTDNYPASESGPEKRDEIDSYTDNYPASKSSE